MNNNDSILTSRNKRKIVGYSLLIIVLYFLVFGYLSVRPFDKWALSPFVDGMLGVFMGAGTIAIITGIILVVQSVIEAERTKKQKVFDQKLALYNDIIEEMKEFYRIKEGEEGQVIDDEERSALFFTQLKVALLSRPKTFRSYSKLLENIAEDDGSVKDTASKLLLEFIVDARDDLDVQQKMSPDDKALMNEAIAIAEKEAEGIRLKGRATYFVGDSPLQQYLSQFEDRAEPELIQTIETVHEFLVNRFSGREGVEIAYTATGGVSLFALGKQRGSKFCYLRLDDRLPVPGEGKRLRVDLYLLKSASNGYAIPSVDRLTTHQSLYGFEFYTVRLSTPTDFRDEIKHLIEDSFDTRVNGGVVSERKSKQELRLLAKEGLERASL